MSEAETIKKTASGPVTIPSLRADLTALGVRPGMVLLVHSSLSVLGWVCGGPVAVILALEETLGPASTLVMPAHSGDLSDPARWENPPVPQDWWETIRETMPAFDPDLTPTRGMGAIAETFRKGASVLRSNHPRDSFAAWGPKAARVTSNHGLDFGLGKNSPLARIYELDGWVLLLGVGHDNNTSLHLAEYRATFPGRKEITNGAPVTVDGRRTWVPVKDYDLNSDDFDAIGSAFERESGLVRRGRVGQAEALLMRQQPLVDFGVAWMNQHRR